MIHPSLNPTALDQDNHQAVAIKTVNRSGLTQKLFENLQGEIEILKALSHRHITRLLDIVVSSQTIHESHPHTIHVL